ncbi:YIP1 family protein [Candidatus Micrarchaeota archaeon]|nr:YIP1 family protein [Candidatus Micrarchaeota archaeon]MBU1682306.1 YIP1 family protein [Candidatus Micrarchaeota archaeon]
MQEYITTIRKAIWVVNETDFEPLLKSGFRFSLSYFLLLLLLYTGFSFVVGFISYGNILDSIIAAVIVFAMVPLIFGFLSVATHMILQLFGCTRPLTDTLQMYTYGSTASLLLGWVPCIGTLASLVSFGNTFRGIRELNKLDFWKTAVAMVVPQILLAILILGLVMFFGMLI